MTLTAPGFGVGHRETRIVQTEGGRQAGRTQSLALRGGRQDQITSHQRIPVAAIPHRLDLPEDFGCGPVPGRLDDLP